MSRKIKTTGDLRGILLDMIEGVQAGKYDAAEANVVVKLAGAVNQSVLTEIETARLALQLNRAEQAFGALELASEPATLPVTIEAQRSLAPIKTYAPQQPTGDLSRARVTDHRIAGKVDLGDPAPGRSALDQRRA